MSTSSLLSTINRWKDQYEVPLVLDRFTSHLDFPYWTGFLPPKNKDISHTSLRCTGHSLYKTINTKNNSYEMAIFRIHTKGPPINCSQVTLIENVKEQVLSLLVYEIVQDPKTNQEITHSFYLNLDKSQNFPRRALELPPWAQMRDVQQKHSVLNLSPTWKRVATLSESLLKTYIPDLPFNEPLSPNKYFYSFCIMSNFLSLFVGFVTGVVMMIGEGPNDT